MLYNHRRFNSSIIIMQSTRYCPISMQVEPTMKAFLSTGYSSVAVLEDFRLTWTNEVGKARHRRHSGWASPFAAASSQNA